MNLKYWLLPAVGAAAMAGVMVTKDVLSAPSDAGKSELKNATTLPVSR